MRLMLCGLSAGLSLADMRQMRMTDVANIVAESAAMRPSQPEEGEYRDATQDDIEWLKGL